MERAKLTISVSNQQSHQFSTLTDNFAMVSIEITKRSIGLESLLKAQVTGDQVVYL